MRKQYVIESAGISFPILTGTSTSGALRLHKFLAAAGVCSRRRAERHILDGEVSVNGQVVVELGTRVNPETDWVEFQGRLVRLTQPFVYIALHKPKGYVTSCSHPGEKIVMDLVASPVRLFPVGRLDKDSTGLILLTNDGAIHHRLLHPSFDHEKIYEVTVASPMDDASLGRLATGVRLRDGMTRPAMVTRISDTRFRIVLREGRNRQIRRMVRVLGHRVKTLHRIRFAGIDLGDLGPGNWRHLSEKERTQLTGEGRGERRNPGDRSQDRSKMNRIRSVKDNKGTRTRV